MAERGLAPDPGYEGDGSRGRIAEETARETETSQWLPAAASTIALVREREGGAWAAGVAIGLADIIGRRRGRTFLANTVPGPGELDGLMDACELPGLTRALAGEMPVSRIARSAPRQSFAYLPAGTPALPLGRLREVPGFRRLARTVAERGGTLLLYVAEEDLLPGGAPEPDRVLPVDGCIAIGDVEDPALLVGAPLLARVERPAGERAAGAGDGAGPAVREADAGEAEAHATLEGIEDEPAAGNRARRRRPLAIAAALAVVALAAWGLLRDPGPAVNPEAADEGAAIESGAIPVAEAAARESEPVGGEPASAAVPPELDAPMLPYSVLVASFARPEDAERQLRQRGATGAPWILAPTPIRDRLYWRILAGAREDRAGGEALMEDLVAEGDKESVRAWDVRPVRLAWLVGVHSDARQARETVARLEAKGLPAYVLAGTADEDRFHAVYAGAYESEEAAAPLGEMLREAGEQPRLVERRGRPR